MEYLSISEGSDQCVRAPAVNLLLYVLMNLLINYDFVMLQYVMSCSMLLVLIIANGAIFGFGSIEFSERVWKSSSVLMLV